MIRGVKVWLGVAVVAFACGSVSAQEGDLAAGEKVFKRCAVCHIVTEAKNKVGPSLHGVFGRPAGTVEGFKYSDAMKNSGIVWSEETIAEYVANPKAYVPKNRMAFPGLKKQDDITNQLAYQKTAAQ
jgi:cytochrome c